MFHSIQASAHVVYQWRHLCLPLLRKHSLSVTMSGSCQLDSRVCPFKDVMRCVIIAVVFVCE
jgi:hypothetical protein